MAITFSHDERPFVITHLDEQTAESTVRFIDIGTVSPSGDDSKSREAQANLRWTKGMTLVILGKVFSEIPIILTVSELRVCIDGPDILSVLLGHQPCIGSQRECMVRRDPHSNAFDPGEGVESTPMVSLGHSCALCACAKRAS